MNMRIEVANRIVENMPVGGTMEAVREAISNVLKDYDIAYTASTGGANTIYWVNNFLSNKKIEGLSPKTLKNYWIYLSKFAREVDKDVERITVEDIRAYLGSKTICENSLVSLIRILSTFFGWLHREEVLRRNPMNKIPTPRGKKNTRKSLTAEELERLRQVTQSKRDKALVEVFASTGCRLSEVVNVKLSDINFRDRTMRVLGKGNKERIVYFSIRAQLLMMDYLESRNKKCENYLFCNERSPFGQMGGRSIEKRIKTLGEEAHIATPLHPHILRHTMATLAHNNGMEITMLQKILGHTELSTTQIYAEVSMSNVKYEYERCVF